MREWYLGRCGVLIVENREPIGDLCNSDIVRMDGWISGWVGEWKKEKEKERSIGWKEG